MATLGFLIVSLLSLLQERRTVYISRLSREAPPDGFKLRETPIPPRDTMLRMIIGMPQNNMTGVEQALLDISDPHSPNYGHYWSRDQIRDHVSPRAETVNAVTDWLNENGIVPNATSAFGHMLWINISAAKANTMFNANFMNYVHERSNTSMLRTLAFSLPANVDEHITFVYPTTHFIAPGRRSLSVVSTGNHTLPRRNGDASLLKKRVPPAKGGARPVEESKPPVKEGVSPVKENVPPIKEGAPPIKEGVPPVDEDARPVKAEIPLRSTAVVDPAYIQKRYGIPSEPATASPSHSLFISAKPNEVASPTDLQTFLTAKRPDMQHHTFSHEGDQDNTGALGTIEANLDTQYTVSLATGVPVTLVHAREDSDDDFGGFLDLFDEMAHRESPPFIFTLSYGWDEAQVSHDLALANTFCSHALVLGMMKTTVIVSSGDGGVEGAVHKTPNLACENDMFMPTFPSSCPHLTSVGSTQNTDPEIGASFSSGGFSMIFPQPAYQRAAVSNYLQHHLPKNLPASMYKRTGRAYPDVSALGSNVEIMVAGKQDYVQGTSASGPIFASVVALLNEARLKKDLPPVGFLNPLLYSQDGQINALTDVLLGSNPGCGTAGFSASRGWDPVTGLGTPYYPRLLESFMTPASLKKQEDWRHSVSEHPHHTT